MHYEIEGGVLGCGDALEDTISPTVHLLKTAFFSKMLTVQVFKRILMSLYQTKNIKMNQKLIDGHQNSPYILLFAKFSLLGYKEKCRCFFDVFFTNALTPHSSSHYKLSSFKKK